MPPKKKVVAVVDARMHTLSVRVSKQELNDIKLRASADGRTCAGYVRYVLFNPQSTAA